MPLVSGTFTANSQTSPAVSFQGSLVALTISGSFSGTIQLQRSLDGGATFVACSTDGTGTAAQWTAPVSVDFEVASLGMEFQLATTAWVSGTAAYQMLWSPAPTPVKVTSNAS